jgi:CBS domain containing-hemolysin-like protein
LEQEAQAMNVAVGFALLILVGLLVLVSYVDRLYTEIGKFLSREFQDNIDSFEKRVEPRLKVSRTRASLSMAILVPLLMAAIAMLIGFTIFNDHAWSAPEILQATLSLVIIVIFANRFLPFVFFARTNGQWLVRWTPLLRVLIYLVLPITLVLGFLQSVTALTKQQTEAQPESPAEAVDALIEAGQEEGIIQESDRDLIQSVVEFSGKTVREAMKPRPDMTAVPVNMTVEQFIDLLRSKPFSRVPVYRDSIHNIVGVLHAQDVLQVPDTEAHARTVESLMRKDVYFVPESKLGSDLLREMRKNNIRMAIVVDEYGGVAGLVTIEDLVEEIVGEISDEHDKQVVKENDHSYIVPGNMDVDHLDELFGIRPEGKEAATVAGLVSELAGRIPQRGEVIQEDGLRFEVLESTDRRVERVRITSVEPQQMKLIE